MTTENIYLSNEVYIRTDNGKNVLRLGMRAKEPRISTDRNEAVYGEHCCDLELFCDGENDETRTISAETRFDLFVSIFMSYRIFVRNRVRVDRIEHPLTDIDQAIMLDEKLEMDLGVGDCVTPALREMINFANDNGYRREWYKNSEIRLDKDTSQSVEIVSDFGQVNIFDEKYGGIENPCWNDKSELELACFVRGAVYLKVVESDYHVIEIEVLESPPSDDLTEYFHVVDVPFITTGTFEISDKKFRLSEGSYVLRWCITGYELIWTYKIFLWKDSIREIKVRKIDGVT